MPDGTIIWTSPSGHTYVTTTGSALLFPTLCQATGGMPAPEAATPVESYGERTAMMPKRHRTRAQNRANRVAAERRQNRQDRQTRIAERHALNTAGFIAHDEPPPF